MRVLITGGKGQLGSELTRIMKSRKSEMGKVPATYLDAQVDSVDHNGLDITDYQTANNYIIQTRPDIIINCAAYTNVDGCETSPEEAFRVNSLGPKYLAISAESIGAKLLHVSTDYVFSGHHTSPYSEYDMPDPKTTYGATKYLGELYVKDFCTRYFIVRTSWLYGPTGKNFAKTILAAGRNKGVLNVVDDQIGNPTYVVDLAYHILQILSGDNYGVYHCSGNGQCSWYEFASKIIEYAHIDAEVLPSKSEDYPSTVKRPKYSALDNMMLRCTFGDNMRDWNEALISFLEKIKREEL